MKKALLATILCLACLAASAQVVEKTYHFENPVFTERQGYEVISFGNCMQSALKGQPSLPWQSVSLLLPQGCDAKDIEIEFSDFQDIEGEHFLYPYQEARPLSEPKAIPFAKDEAVYSSREIYPEVTKNKVKTYHLNGCSFAFAGFTPVRYVPATGKVSYARSVTVRVGAEVSKADNGKMLWLTPETEGRVKRLAQNPEAVSEYKARAKETTDYELLVITPEEWVAAFDEYKAFYDARGLRTHVVSTEYIYETMEGRDNQEKIREYIKQEYENNGIMMVNLGGDVALVPYRSLYCFVSESDIDNLPADMYYACLDGTWDDDEDGVWGEIGEDDLLPELAIGRMCFNNETQFNNIMHKTLTYQAAPVLGEFQTVVLGAEHLGDGYYGSADMERLVGGSSDFDYTTVASPESYEYHKYYASPTLNWSGRDFRDVIVQGGQYVHHVGHANTDYVAGWYNTNINDTYFAGLNGVDHNYGFFHSHGCVCGDFSHSCIMELMTTVSTGFVAVTGNSRYGWYIPWGDGPAAHLEREFVDAYYNDNLPYIGTAFVEMKIMTAPYINSGYEDYGALRWNYYDLNIMGDVAVCPWLDEPYIPQTIFAPALAIGTESTEVHIMNDNAPQKNFRCSLFQNNERIAFGLTNEEGVATLEFAEPLASTDEMQLIVTGQNAYPQTLSVLGFDNDTPWVYINEYECVNDDDENRLVSGNSITMNADFLNSGNVNAENVTAAISFLEPEYVTVTGNNVNVGNVASNESVQKDAAFSFEISDDVPDGTYIHFVISCTDGYHQWNQEITSRVYAPEMKVVSISYDDAKGNNDGFIDPGETVTLHVSGINAGHSKAFESLVNGGSQVSYVTFIDNDMPVGDLEPGEAFNVLMDFYVEENAEEGLPVDLLISLISGNYVGSMTYTFVVGAVKETFETGDFSRYEWYFEHDLPWVIDDTEAYAGTYSAATGAIGDDEVSSMFIRTNSTTDGEISFFLKTDTEKNKDLLAFFIDNKMQDWWSGDNDWFEIRYEVSAGEHLFEWRYDKNGGNAVGADRAWVDNITFPGNTIVLNVLEESAENEIDIFPNPAENYIVVKGGNIDDIRIFNAMGQMVCHRQGNGENVSIDLSPMPSGVYILRATSKDGAISTGRFIKK